MNRVFALLLLFVSFCDANEEQPNFVLVLAHELGRDWVSCYGAEHPTPNLDRLAADGIRYETAWSMLDGDLSHKALVFGRYPSRMTEEQPSFVKLSLIHI